jgi:hypothetical protein
MDGMSKISNRLVLSWVVLLAVAAIALLIAWLSRVVSVPLTTLLTGGAVAIALTWLVVLTTVPWNLYFAARRAGQEMAVSRQRGITVRAADDAEAAQISRRMLRLAVAAHLGTALAAAAVAFLSGSKAGYYVAGIALFTTVFRPAAAYLLHVRERVRVLTRQSTHPRDDVATLRDQAGRIDGSVRALRAEVARVGGDLRRAEAAAADSIAHTRSVLLTDVQRVQERQETDRIQARSAAEELGRRIDQLVRQIEVTLDGLSDHQELLTGLRALVRMVRSEPA